ncbi:ABC transporter substrate-binding protein [Luteimicrobium album]|uniref:ABC transporter substrate-binding protein n=1 Tax=Luteimicrobium album TaxID=1054550 RepID=A0ABQ6I638_9MICO|nr:iron-siderophore ABC transporter substrate-binding protein [Luteimicrobium album]GMA26245.1 ABC transporter substrate-binding protein [Luteimicrobium album]
MRARRGARSALVAVAGLATAVALAACGTTEAPSDAATTPGATTAAPSSGPVTVQGERGKVALDAPAQRVVTLEWGFTEDVLALGVTPVGMADPKGYGDWDTVAPVPSSTADVGETVEPNVEAVAALHPDLVVASTDLPAGVTAQLAKRVPVLVLRGSDASDPVAYMRRTITTLGQATGTADRAEQVLAAYDAKIASGKEALDAAGKAAASFTMADGWLENGTVSVRMYTPGSFFGAVAADLGLTNRWTTGGDKDYGLATTDVEGLTKVTDPGTTFLYVANDADGGDPFATGLKDNKVWKQLPFVAAGNVQRIPDGIWMFGGPTSAVAYVDAVVAAVTGSGA